MRELSIFWTRKTESYGADPYAKRTAGRVAAAPALQSNPVGPAPRTPQAHACRRLEYLHLAAPRTHRTNVRQRFRQAPGRHRPAPHLNLSPKPIAMYHQIHTYTELQKQIHDDLRIQHPEWVEPNGECPTCDSYEARLMELLGTSTRTRSDESIALLGSSNSD
jgi:hypothetical protein